MPRNHPTIGSSGTVDRWTGQLSVRRHGAWTGVCIVRPPCNSRSPSGRWWIPPAAFLVRSSPAHEPSKRSRGVKLSWRCVRRMAGPMTVGEPAFCAYCSLAIALIPAPAKHRRILRSHGEAADRKQVRQGFSAESHVPHRGVARLPVLIGSGTLVVRLPISSANTQALTSIKDSAVHTPAITNTMANSDISQWVAARRAPLVRLQWLASTHCRLGSTRRLADYLRVVWLGRESHSRAGSVPPYRWGTATWNATNPAVWRWYAPKESCQSW